MRTSRTAVTARTFAGVESAKGLAGFTAAGLALFASGVSLSYGLYKSRFFSWQLVTDYSAAVAVGIAIAASVAITFVLTFSGGRRGRQASILLAAGWFGATAGLLAPPVLLGMDAPFAATAQVSSDAQVSSEVYSLELSEAIVLPDEIINIVAPNSDIALTPYAVNLGPGRLIVALGANVGRVDLDDLDPRPFESNAALAILYREPDGNAWTASGILELGQVSEGIQQIRDLQVFDGRALISNVRVADGCIALELWSIAFDESPLVLTDSELLFTSSPALCGGRRNVNQSGGRIAVDGGGQVLLTVGDFRLGPSSTAEEAGFKGRPAEMQPPNSYGMTHRIKPDGSSEIVSVGHRNQQGLHVDQVTGDVWLSEHGPRAGGEVNLVVEGKDYGWPDVTYGLPYGENLPAGGWEVGRWGGRHEGFTQPVFSWMPSIAPSQLIVYRGEEFTAWDGDLIVSTLLDQSLRRLRMAEGRVVFDERIEIGERIRDMVLLDDGKILLAFDGRRSSGVKLKILRLPSSP